MYGIRSLTAEILREAIPIAHAFECGSHTRPQISPQLHALEVPLKATPLLFSAPEEIPGRDRAGHCFDDRAGLYACVRSSRH
jgi:hypothetical protein